jgi:small basic protein
MADSWDDLTAGGQNVRFEETLDLRDETGAKPYIVHLLVLLLPFVSFALGAWFIMNKFIAQVGGVDVAVSIVTDIWSEWPWSEWPGIVLGIALIISVSFVVYGFGVALLAAMRALLAAMRAAFDKQVHTRVTDSGVSVRREGSWFAGQSSGVDIPFDAITAVEYLDPEESSTRLETNDLWSKQFFAGRSKNWIRIEQGDDPTVYIGSDRPSELAETIVRRTPGVETAEPL